MLEDAKKDADADEEHPLKELGLERQWEVVDFTREMKGGGWRGQNRVESSPSS